ncbi:MAG: hypothetical protein QM490_04970 [Candidatus Gracilibacteria bacterium]
MSIYKKNNKFVSYLIILITLFILVLITKGKFDVLQEKLDSKETLSFSLDEKREELLELNAKKDELAKSSENIDKYMVEIKEDELIDYIYSYIEKINDRDGVVIVKSISISEPEDTEIGFKQSNITLNLRIPNETRLKQILDFLTGPESKYNFFISSFSFPYSNTEGSYNVSVPLKVLHK